MQGFALRLFQLVSGRERLFAYLIAGLTVLMCWAVILGAGERIKSADEPDYLVIANSMAFNGSFAMEDGTPTAYRAPGIVFFLAPLVRLGAGIVELRMANAVLVGLSLLLLFSLVRRNAGPLAGLVAVAMVPLWPVVIYTATTLYPQTLGAFLVVLAVWLLDRFEAKWQRTGMILAGVTFGLLVLTIPVFLLTIPVFALWILLRYARGVRRAVLFCAVAAVVVSTWTVRNYIVFNDFIPVATSSGYNLIYGYAPEARYDTNMNIRLPGYVYTEITGKDEVEKNNILTHLAIEEIKKDPERALKLYFAKFLHWFDFSNKLTTDTVVEGGASDVPVQVREVLLFVTYFAVIAIPLLWHLLLMRSYPFKRLEIFSWGLWIVAGLAFAIFITRVRYRLPVDWLVISSNGIFLAAVIEKRFGALKDRLRAD